MMLECKYFNGQYYLKKDNKRLLPKLYKNFDIEGTVHFWEASGKSRLINIDGSLHYKGADIKELYNLKFGIIRGHACFQNIVIKEWSELPKIAYANLLTFRYCQKLGLLRLLEKPDFDWNCPDGIVRLIPIDSTDKNHETIDRNVCHTELKAAFAIIKKHHASYQSAEKRKTVYLAAQKELIESGYVDFAKH